MNPVIEVIIIIGLFILYSILLQNYSFYSSFTVFYLGSDTENRIKKNQNQFIWSNNTKYTEFCSRLKHSYNDSSPILAFQFAYGGFGNQLYTMLASALIATAGHFHLYYVYPHYNMLFNGCYSDSIIKTKDKFSYQNVCDPLGLCFPLRNKTWDIEKALQHNNTLLKGILMSSDPILNNPKYNATWLSLLNGIEENPSAWNMRKMMLRMILNPEPKLQKRLLMEKKQLLKYPYTIGLQLRMGGSIADSPEKYVGIPFNRIDNVINQVREVIKKKKWEKKVQVYISSDSSKTIQYIRNQTKNEFPVVESLLFEHGHSSSHLVKKKYVNVMRKVISDMYYMSISDYLLVSWQSSLGRMMCYLAEEGRCDTVLNWRIENKKIEMK